MKERLSKVKSYIAAHTATITFINTSITLVALVIAFIAWVSSSLHQDRERVVWAWQIVNTSTCGNSGKVDALEFLHSNGVDLRAIDLSNDSCKDERNRVSLEGIDLRGSILQKANLRGIDLHGADLRDIDLFQTKLSSIEMNRARLEGAMLRDTTISHAKFFEVRLARADLSGAICRHTLFDNSDLQDTDLRRTDLQNATLLGVRLARADLSGAICRYTWFHNTDLQDADLRQADLRFSKLDSINVSSANFGGADMRGTELKNVWAWKDQPPLGIPSDWQEMILYCDPGARRTYLRTKRFGVPEGCE